MSFQPFIEGSITFKIEKMKALTYCKTKDCFQVQELPIPTPNHIQMLIRVHACSLNPIDTKIVHWNKIVDDMEDDFIVGLDVVGEIMSTPEKNTSWKIGDKVLFHGNMFDKHGGLAEYCLQDFRTLTALPNNVPIEVAASTPCAGWTAWRSLVDKLQIQKHNSIFIAGGSGGVGSFAIQIAKYFGVETIITSCSQRNIGYAKRLGATHVIDYENQNIINQLRIITKGNGVNVALDCVGGGSELYCANALQFEGQMVELVETANLKSYHQAKARGLTVHQISFGAGYKNGVQGRQSIQDAGNAFNKLLNEGHIQAPQIQKITLEQAADALKEMRGQRTVGKVVVMLKYLNGSLM